MTYPAVPPYMPQHVPHDPRRSNVFWDLRSDTVTLPCDGMRAAMQQAKVDDNVLGHDPTVALLEQRVADMLGKESALFVSSGTQSNLIATLCHCQRGDAIITGKNYHLYKYEAGGASVLGGLMLHGLPLQADGSLDPTQIDTAVAPDDVHFAPTRLLSLENTVGGQAIALETMTRMTDVAQQHGLAVHLDGARFFNAVTALDCNPAALAAPFDSISVCLSKGLGAPVGSLLVANKAMIARAKRWQKILGGGMRQSGILAAAGLYALEHGIARLAQDHQRAATLAQFLHKQNMGTVSQHTNMVFWSLEKSLASRLTQDLSAHAVAILADTTPLRLVLHHQITDQGLGAIQHAVTEVLS